MMSQVRIVTDSIADIPASFVHELDITVVPCNVHFGTETFQDGINLTNEAFYARLRTSPILPTTSQPSVGVFEETYRRLLQTADHIVSIHIPAKASGTFNAAMAAARAVSETRIVVIDSTQITMALGWIVIRAAQAARQGCRLDEVVALVHELIPRARLLAVLDTLEYVQRGGRIGRSAALMGTLLRVKPIVQFLNSELLPVENVRTQRRALQRLIELVAEYGPLDAAAVIHADAAALAQEVRTMLEVGIPTAQIPIAEAGPVLGAHAGPGAIGVAFLVKNSFSTTAKDRT